MMLLSLGLIAGSSYLGLCTFLYFYQTRLIFRPEAQLTIRPEILNIQYKEVWIPTTSSAKLHGWWLPRSKSHGKDADRVLLYLHGNAQNIGGNLENAYRYQQMGFSVLLFDYRGYGLSDGPFPSESQVYEDAAAAWAYLTQTKQIPATSIWLFGHSLGGAVAIDLAQKHPDIAGLIIESSFSSMGETIKSTGQYNMVPVDLLLTQQFKSVEKVPHLTMPVLYIHGLEDSLVPADMSQVLYDASPEPKSLWFVPDADHDNVGSIAGVQYFEMVKSFIEQSNFEG